MQKAVVVDFGGKSIVLYGFTDFKATSDYLKSKTTGVVLPTPYTKDKAPALTVDGKPDFQNAVYAMVSIVRADNLYAETGYNNDPKHDEEVARKNQRGILKPEVMTQGTLTFYIVNPAQLNSVYLDGTLNFNPDAIGMFLDHFLTSHPLARRLARRGCSENIFCRKAFLKSVIQLAKNGYYDDTENNFFMMTTLRDQMIPMISIETLPQHHFSYPSHTIPDLSPLASPGPISPIINPAFPRKEIDGLWPQPGRDLQELVATQMLLRGYEGIGFLYAELSQFKTCHQSNLEELFNSNSFLDIVQNWNLNDSDQAPQNFISANTSVLEMLAKFCSPSGESK